MLEVTGPVRYRAGVPVYRFRNAPDTPSVSVMRFDASVPDHRLGHGQRHIHDFPVLIYVERASGATLADPPLPVEGGDACVLAAGVAIGPTVVDPIALGSAVFFDPSVLGGDGAPWSSHPLLFPFLHGIPGGLLRLKVPPERRPVWSATITAIETELAERAEGYRQAVLAHLTLLLVDVARLATDVVGDLRRSNQTMLADVFDVIEQRLATPLSLRDVATSVGVTPGYLTTLVRQRTGRTVVDWITEQRLVKARRLLTDTDLPIGEVARRVGMPDPGYFARVFRRGNGVSPREWRKAAAASG
jgi:AraC family transcriptional activator of pobA